MTLEKRREKEARIAEVLGWTNVSRFSENKSYSFTGKPPFSNNAFSLVPYYTQSWFAMQSVMIGLQENYELSVLIQLRPNGQWKVAIGDDSRLHGSKLIASAITSSPPYETLCDLILSSSVRKHMEVKRNERKNNEN